MGIGEAVSTCFRKYVDFQGRARRSEFWFFRLFTILFFVASFLVIGGTGAAFGEKAGHTHPITTTLTMLLMLAWFALLLPDLAVTVRRLHDTNHSGWWLLLSLVPFGFIVLLVWFCTEGTRGDNSYGYDPFGPSARVFE